MYYWLVISMSLACTVHCDDGDVRLLMGERVGPVEVCDNKRWVAVCGYGPQWRWSNDHASVVCTQLGYDTGRLVVQFTSVKLLINLFKGKSILAIPTLFCIGTVYPYEMSRSPHILPDVCAGTEFRLSDCSYITVRHYYCYWSAGVTCELGNHFAKQFTHTHTRAHARTHTHTHTHTHTADCVDGEVRLSEGETEWEGRLEVCFSRRWGTVGSEGWSQVNTEIVCNDLGYEPDMGKFKNKINGYTHSLTVYSPRPATNSMPAL